MSGTSKHIKHFALSDWDAHFDILLITFLQSFLLEGDLEANMLQVGQDAVSEHPHLSNGLSWLITLSVCKCVFFKQKYDGAGQTYPASTSSSDCQENKQSMECYGIQGSVGDKRTEKKMTHSRLWPLSLSLKNGEFEPVFQKRAEIATPLVAKALTFQAWCHAMTHLPARNRL